VAETRKTSGLWSWLQFVLAAAFVGWCSYKGGSEVWRALETGLLRHGKGPDVALSDRPLVFWALNGFYGVSVLAGVGFAVFCLALAFQDVRKRGVGR
jgi:hypothetical protein